MSRTRQSTKKMFRAPPEDYLRKILNESDTEMFRKGMRKR